MTLLPETADLYRELYGINTFIKGLTQGVDLRVEEVFTPTCTICGLTSGYQGEGSKTVLPAKASAKLDFRLVPDQEPEEVLAALRDHLDDEGFEDVQINFLGGESPARTDPDDPFVKLVCDTALEVYAKPMKLIPLSGGSGPNGPFVHDLGLPVVTAGLGYPDSRSHSPNENIRLDLYLKHARHICRILMEFGSNT
jgi:acetylornithine deacetylase/succinyl-diaminopimelate desuccinylase-like protein